jgi:hypothetical protein
MRDRCRRSRHRRHFVHREIGDPVDKSFVQVRIAIRKNPDEWGPDVSTAAKEDGGVVEASCQR